MKKKFYHPCPYDPDHYELQGTKTEFVLSLIVGLIVVVSLVYWYYTRDPSPPKPVEIQQEGFRLPTDLTESHEPVEVATPEVQGAQMAALTPEEAEIMQLSGEALDAEWAKLLNGLEDGSEEYNRIAGHIKWFKKDKELIDRETQVAEKLSAALEEAARVSETEEQLKKEMRRILTEMGPEMLEAERLYQEHQKQNLLEQ